jgi:hypothetical protein
MGRQPVQFPFGASIQQQVPRDGVRDGCRPPRLGLRCKDMPWPTQDSPLYPWLSRTARLRPFAYYAETGPDLQQGGFLGIEKRVDLQNALSIPAQDLATSWQATKEYVEEAMELVSMPDGGSLDRDEVEMIRKTLGEPPATCCPIYMITVQEQGDESLVYVGKTSSVRSRFGGGHAAITKLHAPQYQNKRKAVYLARIMLLTGDDYLPLEWVHPLSLALDILDSVEAELIFSLVPELNIQKKRRSYVTHPCQIQIQNFIPDATFLNDKFVGPSWHWREHPNGSRRR